MSGLKAAKDFGFTLLIVVTVLLIADSVAYWLVPKHWVGFAPGYKSNSTFVETQQSKPNYSRGYPRNYFRIDEKLGFDIQESVAATTFKFSDSVVEIFSNRIGCFDKNSPEQILRREYFDYFAGDSYTWGYANYETKFPVIYERLTGRPSLKCGVTHTGQLHQFGKFKRIINSLMVQPNRVFVGYSSNDPSNDFVHPHTTVVSGFQVDLVDVSEEGDVFEKDLEAARVAIANWLESSASKNTAEGTPTPFRPIANFLKRYSLVSNLLNFGWGKLNPRLLAEDNGASRPDTRVSRYGFYHLDGFYRFDETYASSPYTARNRNAIEEWMRDAKESSYRLIFVLIPPKSNYDDTEYFHGLRTFLSEREIEYIDLTYSFKQSKISSNYFYWYYDGHLNDEGNEFVGRVLAQRYM